MVAPMGQPMARPRRASVDPRLVASVEAQLRRHWNADRVSALLKRHLAREQATWRPRKYASHTSSLDEITGVQRDYTVRWFSAISSGFGLPRDVLFLATTLFDEFLQLVRAKPRFLQVIACSCFLLAAKMCLDDDAVPALADLIRSGGCECSVSEVRRMEKVILDRFQWDITRATSLDFLHAYHALLESNCEPVLGPEGPARVAALKPLWETKLQLLLAHNTLLEAERPSTVALALVSLEVEALSPASWLPVTAALQGLLAAAHQSGTKEEGTAAAAPVSVEQVVRCREQMARHLQHSGRRVQLLSERRQASKRKMPEETLDDDQENCGSAATAGYYDNDAAVGDNDDCIYDSIKKLYAAAEMSRDAEMANGCNSNAAAEGNNNNAADQQTPAISVK